MNTWQFGIAFTGIFLAGGVSGFLLQRWMIGAKMLKAMNEGMALVKCAADDLVKDRKELDTALDGAVAAAHDLSAGTISVYGLAREQA